MVPSGPMTRGLASSRWAILRIRLSGPYVIVRYTDSRGRRESEIVDGRTLPPPLFLPPSSGTLSQRVQELAQGLPDFRPGPHNTGPVPVALFVSPPPLVSLPEVDTDVIRFASTLLLDQNRLQVARLASGKPLERAPFRLPFRILATDDAATLALSNFVNSGWYSGSEETRAFGFQVATASDDAEAALRDTERDIVVTESAQALLTLLGEVSPRWRPRLVIALDPGFLQPAPWRLPRGVALLRLPHPSFGGSVAGYVSSFLHGLIHDLPLHEAVKAAVRQIQPLFTPELTADPISNESLRILQALAELKRQRERLEARLPSLNVAPLLDRARDDVDVLRAAAVLEPLAPPGYIEDAPIPGLTHLMRWVEHTRSLPRAFTNFEQEGQGLVPMAAMEAEYARLRAQESAVVQQLRAITDDPAVSRLLRRHQRRVLDVALSRLETSPLLEPLDKASTLAAGAAYKLRVHVGNPMSDSIVSGETPPIDPLLPDPEDARGHRLEVAIQGKAFEVLGERSQGFWLPEFGGSEPVYFEVRAPEHLGPTELRICLYYRNHLVQSYVLSAVVTSAEQQHSDSSVERLSVMLEFSRTERFTNLDELRPRALSLGVNSGASSATHELMVKADKAEAELTLFPSTYANEVKKFRDMIEAAARDPSNPNAPRSYPVVPAGQAPAADVQDTLRDLMRKGSDLYDAVFNKAAQRSTDLRKALVRIKKSANEKLQVVRFDDNFVFPWSVLYDFPLPDDIYGQAPLPVCLGVDVDASGKTVDCAHIGKDRVYCVRGFWGVRHYMEELIGQGTSVDAKVDRAAEDAIRIVADSTLASTSTLIQNLTTAIGSKLVANGPADADLLADLMWKDPPERPSILIVLGHLETRLVVGEPTAPRIVLVPQSKWLTRKLIADRAGNEVDGWKQPRSVIMLMVCESAATTAETVNDFVTAWNTAGAGAIIGTETIVGSGLSATFAEEVTQRLWSQEPLGKAMTEFRRLLLGQGNPLAFIFHAIGDTDLTLK